MTCEEESEAGGGDSSPDKGIYSWREVEIYREELFTCAFPDFMRSRWDEDVEMPTTIGSRHRATAAYVSTPYCSEQYKKIRPFTTNNRFIERMAHELPEASEIVDWVSKWTAHGGSEMIKAWEAGKEYLMDFEGKTDVTAVIGERGDLSELDRIQFTFDDATRRRLNHPYPLNLVFQDKLQSLNGFSSYHRRVSQHCRDYQRELWKEWYWCLKTESFVAARNENNMHPFGWMEQGGINQQERRLAGEFPRGLALEDARAINVLRLPPCEKKESNPSIIHRAEQRRGEQAGRRQRAWDDPQSSRNVLRKIDGDVQSSSNNAINDKASRERDVVIIQEENGDVQFVKAGNSAIDKGGVTDLTKSPVTGEVIDIDMTEAQREVVEGPEEAPEPSRHVSEGMGVIREVSLQDDHEDDQEGSHDSDHDSVKRHRSH
jgi:hypothetical protein